MRHYMLGRCILLGLKGLVKQFLNIIFSRYFGTCKSLDPRSPLSAGERFRPTLLIITIIITASHELTNWLIGAKHHKVSAATGGNSKLFCPSVAFNIRRNFYRLHPHLNAFQREQRM